MADDPARSGPSRPPSPSLHEGEPGDDAHLEAFFRTGDEGTYDGGPAVSLAPVYSDFDDPAETLSEAAIAERLARRARYQHLVTRLVGALGVAAALALAWGAVRAPTDSLSAPPPVAAVQAPRVEEAAPFVPQHVERVIPPPPPEPVAAAAIVEAPPAPAADPPARAPESAAPAPRLRAQRSVERRLAPPEPPRAPLADRVLPRGSASFSPAAVRHASSPAVGIAYFPN